MKKLSVLIALALCLTITGAYAAWSYSMGHITTDPANVTISMDGIDTSKAMGTIEVVSTPSYVVKPNGNTYNPTLAVADGSDAFVITFKPDEKALADIKAYGPTTQIQFTSTYGVFEEKQIITVKMATDTLDWGTPVDGVFTITISAADFLTKYISCDGTVSIDNPTEYDTYNGVLGAGTISVVITTNVTP